MRQNIQIHNQKLQLHPLGGLFWVEKSLLLISDVHLGKVSHFRKFGAAVPRKAIHKNFLLLDQIVADFEPFQICFLGDLFHSSLNKEWELFEKKNNRGKKFCGGGVRRARNNARTRVPSAS